MVECGDTKVVLIDNGREGGDGIRRVVCTLVGKMFVLVVGVKSSRVILFYF